ncbi:MAG: class I tRNA ligase family protein [Candidatus Peregrinibacteria bacterium]
MTKSFRPVDPKQSFPALEENMLEYWKQHDIFKKSVDQRDPANEFIFFDGPPFATGTPHYGHILAGTLKDAIPRYQTMKGKRVERKFGWDCHGVPVEFQVEKEQNIGGKPGIEAMGVGKFNEMCRSIVMRCADEWETTVERMGRFVDFQNSYRTMDLPYMESVWSVFKALWEKGLIYEGEKVIAYSPKLGSPLSNFEAGLNYKQIKDKTAVVKFKITNDKLQMGEGVNTYLLAWTTTPWTLPSNLALCVNPEIEYVQVEYEEKIYKDGRKVLRRQRNDKEKTGSFTKVILAKNLLNKFFGEGCESLIIYGDLFDKKDPNSMYYEKTFKGSELIGLNYEPLFPFFGDHKNAFQVLGDNFVSDSDGTGIVHLAPNFGEEDARVCHENGISYLSPNPIDENGYFDMRAYGDTPLQGKYFRPDETVEGSKENNANDWVLRHLKESGHLFKQDQVDHDYPFCWRTECALMYRGIKTWFVDVSKIKATMLAENENIEWIPDHLKHGRFGKILEGAPDWAISRNRYWGAPIPVWRCDECGHTEVVSTKEELEQKTGKTITDLHKHFVDDLVWECSVCRDSLQCVSTMRRIPEVLDCWFESGAMPYASRGIHFQKNTDGLLRSTRNDETQIFIMRHGESAKNFPIKLESCTMESAKKYPLTPKGREMAEAEAKKYENAFDVIVSSPFLRAKETAEIFQKHSPHALFIQDIRLKDIDVGEFDDQLLSVSEKYRKEVLKNNPSEKFGGGETLLEVQKRVLEVFEEVQAQYPRKRILMVSHGCPLEVLQDSVEGKQISYWEKSFPNTTVKQLENQKIQNPNSYQPADFIAEGLDQTRGWFYTLHVLGCALYGKNIYKNVITNGIILAEDGQKMSKSKKNYPNPAHIFNKYGADAMRFYLLSSPAVKAENLRFSEKGVEEVLKNVILPLWNTYSFFVTYANIDGWEPSFVEPLHATALQNPLDKWILSRLQTVTKNITDRLDAFDVQGIREIIPFLDDLTNWFVRRSRRRFWKSESDTDKNEAYTVLHRVLVQVTKLLAPVCPFLSDEMYQNLTGKESVHLEDWVYADENLMDTELEVTMGTTRTIVSLGLALRGQEKIKVRQPLSLIKVALPPHILAENLEMSVIAEELNVKTVEFVKNPEEIAEFKVSPNARLLGPKYGKEVQEIIKEAKSGNVVVHEDGQITVAEKWTLMPEEMEVGYAGKEGGIVASEKGVVVLLNTEISEELRIEGFSRELVRNIQDLRKTSGFEISDRIVLSWYTQSDDLKTAFSLFGKQIEEETLTAERKELSSAVEKGTECEIEGETVWLAVKVSE